MNVSLKWLNELVKIDDISIEELTKQISLYSIEIDSMYRISNASNVVIGYVLEKEKHPSADKLSVCQVDVGGKKLQIICGAPNVEKHQKVVVALEGAVLPNDFLIKKSVIRGIESNGMICSLKELGLEKKYIPEEFQDGIYVLDQDAVIGSNALTYLGFNDLILELGLTPNRSDLLSMRGVANDVAAVLNKKVNPIQFELKESTKSTKDYIQVENLSENCISYYAKVVEDVVIGPSPNWIKSRLIASGIRPINNVVDITNYILMLFGQPLHAFDFDKLGKRIVVRNAFDQEKTITLDGEKRTLQPSDVVITNGLEVVAIAGVMGCENTEVSKNTTRIVLEAAVFDPKSVRKTSSRLGLRSESSTRFERGVDINQTELALNYACFLLKQYASASIMQGTVSTGQTEVENKVLEVSQGYVNSMLGLEISISEICKILEILGFKTTTKKEMIQVVIPSRRLDISIKEDIIEEIGRIHGYENLPITLPKGSMYGGLTNAQKRMKQIRRSLSGIGLKEVITYSLVSHNAKDLFHHHYTKSTTPVQLANPMSEERSTMRLSLIPSLLEVVSYNNARRTKDVHLFEIGSIYYQTKQIINESKMLSGVLTGDFCSTKWNGKTEVADYYIVKGVLDNLLNDLGLVASYKQNISISNELHPNRSAEVFIYGKYVGFIGQLHPKYERLLGLNDVYVFELCLDEILHITDLPIKYEEVSKVPSVERDLSFTVEKSISADEIIRAIQNVNPMLIKNILVFDLYKGDKIGDNEYSIAVRLTIQGKETLNEDQINAVLGEVIKTIQVKLKANLRF